MINVNNIIVAAEKAINTFSAKSDKSNKELQSGLVRAQGHLAYLRELHNDFHAKIEQFGPKIPTKHFDGHELTIRNRCFGDGRDPNDCGRWFVKCYNSDHEGRSCYVRGFLIGDVSDDHLQSLLDLKDQMLMALATIESLCPKLKPSRKSYDPTPVPRRSQKNDGLSSSSVGSTQRKGSRKKNVDDDRVTILIKVWLKSGKSSLDFMATTPTYERGRAFFSLSCESSVKEAIGSYSVERFNGTYWDKIHITTTFSVRSGDIILIRAVGIGLCPGLEEQVALSSPAQSANDRASSSSVSMVCGPRVDKLSQGKRKRVGDNLVGGVGKYRMISDGEGFARAGPTDVIDLSSDSD